MWKPIWMIDSSSNQINNYIIALAESSVNVYVLFYRWRERRVFLEDFLKVDYDLELFKILYYSLLYILNAMVLKFIHPEECLDKDERHAFYLNCWLSHKIFSNITNTSKGIFSIFTIALKLLLVIYLAILWSLVPFIIWLPDGEVLRAVYGFHYLSETIDLILRLTLS